MCWMPSHSREATNDKVWPEDITEFDVWANNQADQNAGLEAEKAQIPDQVVAKLVHNITLATKIQKHISYNHNEYARKAT